MEKLPTYYLEIDEDSMKSGVDTISFVTSPATQLNWTMFSVLNDTFNDYPKAASENACRALKYQKENKTDCGTLVGLKRANQLCNGDKLSLDTIGRMASFKRHQQNKDVPYDKGCGGISWDFWGGDEGVEWALRKMEWANRNMWNNNMSKLEFSLNEEKRIITAPVMLAETPILRFNPTIGKYYVKFKEETILKMMKKYFKENKIHRVNEEHDPTRVANGVYMIESFIVGDRNESKLYPDLPKGSWVASFFIEDETYWNEIKENGFTGFSLEGFFKEDYETQLSDKLFNSVKNILFSNLPDEDKEQQIKLILGL
jgi:hypothetical protein